MRKSFTYIIALVLFAACAFNDDIIQGNMTEDFFGFVSRNVQKDRTELFADMKEITKQGLIFFEVYDEAGELIAILDEPRDFDSAAIAQFDKTKYMIKSVSKMQMNLNVSLPSDF